jgi:hypothetical protein
MSAPGEGSRGETTSRRELGWARPKKDEGWMELGEEGDGGTTSVNSTTTSVNSTTTSVNSTTTWMLGRWACRGQLGVSRLEGRGMGRRGRCRCGLGGGHREGDRAGVEDAVVHDAAAHAYPGAADGDGERPWTGRSRATTRFPREVWQRRRDFRGRGGDDSRWDWGGREGRAFHQRRAGMGEECLRRCAVVGARYMGGGGALRQQGQGGAHRDARLGGRSRGGMVDALDRVL